MLDTCTLATKFCAGCRLDVPVEDFYYLNKARGYLRSKCKKCLNKQTKAHWAENIDALRKHCRKKRKEVYHSDIAVARAKNRRWAKQYQRRLRAEVLEKLGGKCVRCGFSDRRALHVDHVYGGGTVERLVLGTSALWRKVLADNKGRYQLLCANCNAIKRYEEKEGWTEC